ncbi:MAG: metal ABC transporter permease [Fimbriimonadaceae bacterium]|nr:metal ABC transporter permease [Fimbriimonadaceae bacterium]
MNPLIWLYIVAGLAGLTCALAGSYLVIRKSSMIADAISHSILPGLVAGFWIAKGPNLLTGMIGAVVSGMVTVWLVEYLTTKRKLKQDAAIGLVFPTLFALGVLWISVDFQNVHLDTDSVLFGEVTLAPFDQLQIGNWNLGPQSLWILLFALLVTTVFLKLFRKELQISTFDPTLATISGFAPFGLHYGLMGIVSISTVSAFAAVGAILAVALIIVPTATARLLAHTVERVIQLAAVIGVGTALAGTSLAILFDLSISGMIAVLLGLVFTITIIVSPERGILAQKRIKRRDKVNQSIQALLIHLESHAGTDEEMSENTIAHLNSELGWHPDWTQLVIEIATEKQAVIADGNKLTVGPNAENYWRTV